MDLISLHRFIVVLHHLFRCCHASMFGHRTANLLNTCHQNMENISIIIFRYLKSYHWEKSFVHYKLPILWWIILKYIRILQRRHHTRYLDRIKKYKNNLCTTILHLLDTSWAMFDNIVSDEHWLSELPVNIHFVLLNINRSIPHLMHNNSITCRLYVEFFLFSNKLLCLLF